MSTTSGNVGVVKPNHQSNKVMKVRKVRKANPKKIKILFSFAAVTFALVTFATPNIILHVPVKIKDFEQVLKHANIKQQQDNILITGFYQLVGSAVRVYCDMTRTCGNITGGWMRVAELDMTRTSSQ